MTHWTHWHSCLMGQREGLNTVPLQMASLNIINRETYCSGPPLWFCQTDQVDESATLFVSFLKKTPSPRGHGELISDYLLICHTVCLPPWHMTHSGNRSSKTFKPKKNIPEGSHQYELLKHAEATLGSGNLRMAVMLPEGEDLNEWVAVNSKHTNFTFNPLP